MQQASEGSQPEEAGIPCPSLDLLPLSPPQLPMGLQPELILLIRGCVHRAQPLQRVLVFGKGIQSPLWLGGCPRRKEGAFLFWFGFVFFFF